MQLHKANLRSSSYFIACAQAACEHCDLISSVIALALPPGHEVKLDDGWQRAESNAFIFHIEELSAPVSLRLMQVAALFRRKCEEGQRYSYWANYCEHCGQMLSEEALHCEPGGFMPTRRSEAEAISICQFAEEFSADAAGYAVDPEFFSSIRRR